MGPANGGALVLVRGRLDVSADRCLEIWIRRHCSLGALLQFVGGSV